MVYQPSFIYNQSDVENETSTMAIDDGSINIDHEKLSEAFINRLEKIRKKEIIRGVSTIGPHRDDIRFLANGIDLCTYGSRGQIRTSLLTLKMAEKEWLKGKTSSIPILLLDEVMAELDLQRRNDLLDYLVNNGQAILTTTDLNHFSKHFIDECTIYKVAGGVVSGYKGDENLVI